MRTSGCILSLLMKTCPPSWRFHSAVRLAHLLEPLIERTVGYRARQRTRTDTIRETSLEFVLMMLTRHGTTFTPQLRIEGLDALDLPATGPTLIVGPHTMLSRLLVRHLEDMGHRPVVIDAMPHRVYGTRRMQRTLTPAPNLLHKVRGILRGNGTVMALIDGRGPGRRSWPVRVGTDDQFVSGALLQLALSQRARIVFMATTLDEHRRVVVSLEAAPAHADEIDDVMRHFASFVQRSLAIAPRDR